MILFAHVFLMPVEEVLVPLASGLGAGTALWLAVFLSPLRAKLRH
jgi:hypothetical protein